MKTNHLYTGDVLEVLRTLPDECVQMVMTSPPYWGLRDYGVKGQIGREDTAEEYVAKMISVFQEVKRVLRSDGTLWLNYGDGYATSGSTPHDSTTSENERCPSGWKQKGGRAQAVKKTVGAWGPSYRHDRRPREDDPHRAVAGLKSKDLIGMPWRMAFALQADGWYLRSDIIFAKPNPMPESVSDRPTKAHEYLFLLSKKARYYYDAFAIMEPCESSPSDIRKMTEKKDRIGGLHKTLDDRFNKASKYTHIGQKRGVGDPYGRNCRSVWNIATQQYKDAHFATFPEELCRRPILAGTSAKGACPNCSAPWKRIIDESEGETQGRYKASGQKATDTARRKKLSGSRQAAWKEEHPDRTIGWRPACKCYGIPLIEGQPTRPSDEAKVEKWKRDMDDWLARWAELKPQYEILQTVPCIVLDPFAGSGTALFVANKHRRRWVGIELSEEYAKLARKRMAQKCLWEMDDA